MTNKKGTDERFLWTYLTHIRREILNIRPRQFILSTLHFLAMNFPVYRLRIVFYKLRGTRIGKKTALAPLVFLEEGHPELITIKENTSIGPNVMVITHDTVFSHLDLKIPFNRTKEVNIGKNCYIGAGAIILPGVTIGDNTIIGAGSVVTRSIPSDCVAMGIPAKVTCSREEWCRKHLVSE